MSVPIECGACGRRYRRPEPAEEINISRRCHCGAQDFIVVLDPPERQDDTTAAVIAGAALGNVLGGPRGAVAGALAGLLLSSNRPPSAPAARPPSAPAAPPPQRDLLRQLVVLPELAEPPHAAAPARPRSARASKEET